MRQPTEESAPCFDSENPDHWECAHGHEYFPDEAYLCMDYFNLKKP